VCENQGRPDPSVVDIPWNSRDLLKRSWAQDFSGRPAMKEVYDELGPMIDTVEQQTLPLIERSLRAVLEMADLFAFGDDKSLHASVVASPVAMMIRRENGLLALLKNWPVLNSRL